MPFLEFVVDNPGVLLLMAAVVAGVGLGGAAVWYLTAGAMQRGEAVSGAWLRDWKRAEVRGVIRAIDAELVVDGRPVLRHENHDVLHAIKHELQRERLRRDDGEHD
jgi:hypothetical protein